MKRRCSAVLSPIAIAWCSALIAGRQLFTGLNSPHPALIRTVLMTGGWVDGLVRLFGWKNSLLVIWCNLIYLAKFCNYTIRIHDIVYDVVNFVWQFLKLSFINQKIQRQFHQHWAKQWGNIANVYNMSGKREDETFSLEYSLRFPILFNSRLRFLKGMATSNVAAIDSNAAEWLKNTTTSEVHDQPTGKEHTSATPVGNLQSQIYDRGWVSLACFGKLWRARSRLYQSWFLQ